MFRSLVCILSKNIPRMKAIVVNAILGFDWVKELAKYLGLPSLPSRSKVGNWEFIVDKEQAKVAVRKFKVLSKAGHLTLVSIVGQPMPTYGMANALFSKLTCNSIDRAICRF